MRLSDYLNSINPRIFSGVLSFLLALILTFSGMLTADRVFSLRDKKTDDKESEGSAVKTSGTPNEGENEDGKAFSYAGAFKLGSSVSGSGAAVADIKEKKVIAEKGAIMETNCGESAVFMVSLIISDKIKSGEISLDDEAVCPAGAAIRYGYSLTSGIFSVGKKMTVRELLFCMLYQRGSAYSFTLAVHASGSEKNFVSEMNEKARAIGMDCTLYSNVCGEDDGISHTSVNDTLLLLKCFLEDEMLSGIFCSDEPLRVRSAELGSSVFLTVENDFFLNFCSRGQAAADGIVAGKVGECGNSFWAVLVCRDGDNEYVSVVMNSRSAFSDSLKAYSYSLSLK